MGALNLEKNVTKIEAKKQDEIHKLLEEIKGFEKKFEKYEIVKFEEQSEIEYEPLKEFKIIENENETLEEFHQIDEKLEQIELINDLEEFETIEEIKKPIPQDGIKNFDKESEILNGKIKKSTSPVTFRYRFNDEGKFENIDITKRKLKTKSKKRFILRRIRIKHREKTESEGLEQETRFSKLKVGLSKLKKVIPNKSDEIENVEEITNQDY